MEHAPLPFQLTVINPVNGQRRIIDVFAATDSQAKAMALKDSSEIVICRKMTGIDAAIFGSGFRRSASSKDLGSFYTAISRCLSIDASLLRGMQHSLASIPSHSLRYAAARMIDEMSTGASAKEGLRCFDGIMPREHQAMIAAGDTAGEIASVFESLAIHTEASARSAGKVKRALYYPLGLFILGFVGFILACIFLIPEVAKMVTSFHGKLPVMTQVSIAFSDFLISYPIVPAFLIIAPIVAVFQVERIMRSGLVQQVVSSAPFLRRLVFKSSMARALSIFSMTLRAHVPAAEALDITASVTDFPNIKRFFLGMKADIMSGQNYFEAANNHRALLGEDGYELISYFSLGDKTGATESVLSKVAEQYTEDVDVVKSNIDLIIGPITIFFIGGMVAFVAISVVLPIVQIGVMAVPKH